MCLSHYVFSLHQGVNKAPVLKPWVIADKDGFKIIKAQFLEFLKTCYCMFVFSSASDHLIKEKVLIAPEEQHMCAFDQGVVVAPSTNPAASTSNINRNGANLNKEGGQTSSLGSVSTSATSRDKGKCKRSKKGSAKHQKKPTKEEKHHDVFNEELDTEDNDEVEDEEDTESSSEEELPNTRSRKGTQGTTMDPLCFIKTGVKSPATGNTDTALSVQLPEPAMVDGRPVIQLSGPTSTCVRGCCKHSRDESSHLQWK